MKQGRLIRSADYPEVPWKNGGGTTREIAAYPPGAGSDDFVWRLSMARVAASGAFSHFANVDRMITILDGTLELDVEGAQTRRLDPTSAPFCFAGDASAFGKPLGSAVTDLNLMVRRGTISAGMSQVTQGPLPVVQGEAVLFSLEDSMLGIGTSSVSMKPHDSYFFSNLCHETVSIDRPALLIQIRADHDTVSR